MCVGKMAVSGVVGFSVVGVVLYLLWYVWSGMRKSSGQKVTKLKVKKKKEETEVSKALRELYAHCEGGERTEKLLILYGTEYGFSKDVANKVAQTISERFPDLAPRVLNMLYHKCVDFSKEKCVLLCCSTTGDGVVPTDAKDFYDSLSELEPNSLRHVEYSVLALGDLGYPHFCSGGILFENALNEVCGKRPFVNMMKIDQEDWAEIDAWTENICEKIDAISPLSEEGSLDYLEDNVRTGIKERKEGEMIFSLMKPLKAPIKVKLPLTTMTDTNDKETVHIEIDIRASGLVYTTGDALGVIASNCPEEVDRLIEVLKAQPHDLVIIPSGNETKPLQDALLHHVDLKTVKPDLVSPYTIELATSTTFPPRVLNTGENITCAPFRLRWY